MSSNNEVIIADVFEGKTSLSNEDLREFIAKLEAEMMKGEQLDVPINHYFSKDVYAREMVVPKGAIIVGKIHKHQNLNIMSSGEASILSIDGVMRVKAPFTFVASPGAKRVFYMHEDTTWTVIHGTAETDVDKIEEEFIAKSYDEVIEERVTEKLEGDLCLG
jgi:hypothetical protein